MLIRFLSEYRPLHPPGTHYEYSNVGFGVLGLALSTASGQSYGEMIRERITRPLGLRDTQLEGGGTPARGGVVGYTLDGETVLDHERGALDAAGALHSSASDLATLIEVALGYRAAPGLARDIAITLETRRPGGQSASDAAVSTTAIGWNVLDTDAGEIVFKSGFGAGFRSFMGYNKQRGLGVVGRGGLGFSDGSESGMTAIFFNDSRSIPDETTETQPLTGLQGEGGFGSLERREDDRAACCAL